MDVTNETITQINGCFKLNNYTTTTTGMFKTKTITQQHRCVKINNYTTTWMFHNKQLHENMDVSN